MPDQAQIVLLTPFNGAYPRQLAQGVRRFARQNPSWRLSVIEPIASEIRGLNQRPLTGLLTFVEPRSLRRRKPAVPTVFLNTSRHLTTRHRVCPDDRAIGAIAAEHFLRRGFRHFAFSGFPGYRFSRQREAGFVERIKAAGHTCAVYQAPATLDAHAAEEDGNALSNWLGALPRPVAIMGCNDNRARHMSVAAKQAGLVVGQAIALIGVDNDEFTSELAEVPLSSVDPGAMRIGYEAAALLARLIENPHFPPTEIVIAPEGIVERQSSDMLAVDDADLAAAIAFIRTHACDPIRVTDILDVVPVARRTLEQKFHTAFGRTLHDEIRSVRLEHARHLLTDTDMTLDQIARRCGFKYPKRFMTVFRIETGTPPGEFRRAVRAGRGTPRQLTPLPSDAGRASR